MSASHYVKMMLDMIFGMENFRNEIVWHYPGRGGAGNFFSNKHDIILYFSKSNNYIFNKDPIRIPPNPRAIDPKNFAKNDIRRIDPSKINTKGKIPETVWSDITILKGRCEERLGYPTQKPEKLLERIILVSSNEGDLVLDPFNGGGTTCVAAKSLGRNYIGIDISKDSIDYTNRRLQQTLLKI